MGRLERHLDQQKVEQLLATGKIEQPHTHMLGWYCPFCLGKTWHQFPEDCPKARWPTPAYRAKLEAKRKRRQRTGYAATGR